MAHKPTQRAEIAAGLLAMLAILFLLSATVR